MRRLHAMLAIATLVALMHSIAGADDKPASMQTVIESRQAGFKKMGAAMKTLSDQSKLDAPDSAKMAAAAKAIGSVAPDQFRWFPQGSGPEAGIDTDALPHIWKDRAKFDSLSKQLIAESRKLTAVMTGNDVAAIKAQVRSVGETCSGCHKSFRAD